MTITGSNVFARTSGTRSYRRIIVISTEGQITEREYFRCIQELFAPNCKIDFAGAGSSNCSHPREVLAKMKGYLAEAGGLKSGDEAWLVVDKDEWGEDQFEPLRRWISEKHERGCKRGIALSDPDFEYWLLLHFKDTGVRNRDDCLNRLRRYLPSYDKHIQPGKYSEAKVRAAIERAKRRDHPNARSGGHSTVYLLVSDMLEP